MSLKELEHTKNRDFQGKTDPKNHLPRRMVFFYY